MDNNNSILDLLESQLNELNQKDGIVNSVDVSNYISSNDKEYDILQANEINKGIRDGLDVSIYRNPIFDFLQMQQIRIGLTDQVDVSLYANPKYSHLAMREIRLGLADNINMCAYAAKISDGFILGQLRLAILHGIDILPYIQDGYDDEQLKEIRISLECGIDISKYLDKSLFGMQFHEIRIGLLNKVDVSKFASADYNWMQMREIRLGLEQHLDVSLYAKPLVTYSQMKEIRLGLEQGLDVSQYKSLMYPASEMCIRRERLLNEKEQNDLDYKTNEFKKNDLNSIDDFIASVKKDEDWAVKVQGEVVINPDMMTASLILSTPNEGELYQVDDIIKMLQSKGIKQGILKDVISQMIVDQIYNREVIIARGKKAVNGDDGFYDFYFPLTTPTKPKILEDGSVDYHDMNLFTLVEKDQLIAEYHAATTGTFGYTVEGSVLLPEKGKEKPYLTGHGFYVGQDKKKFYSSFSGKIEFNKYVVSISRAYVVQKDVDVSTGNIEFDGDVLVKGDVLSGYMIRATGSISIEGHAESVMLIAGKDIVVKKGLQGNNTASITAGADVYGSYFEAVAIKCGNNLNANYLLNTNVKSFGKVNLAGKKGVILGGSISASDSITAYTVGNPSMIKTELQVGTSKEITDKYDAIVNKIDQVQSELSLLIAGRNKIINSPTELNDQLKEMVHKIDVAEQMKNDEMIKLCEERDILTEKFQSSSRAKITVKGITYVGTKITVQMKSLDIGSQVKHVFYSCYNNEHVAVTRL